MARKPDHPWYWAAQDVWVVQWRGKRIRLAKGKKGRAEARVRFHKMMTEAENEPPAGGGPSPPVGLLVALYLEDLLRRREAGDVERQTKEDAERRLAGFGEMHGDLPADQIKPHHVDSWLATKAKWGKTSRHDGVGAVKSVFKWAVKKGHLDANPVTEMEKPKRVARREAIPSAPLLITAFSLILSADLLDLLTFVHETGCRPIEARQMEAKHLDRVNGLAVFTKHKTAHSTGRKRVLYLSPKALEIATRLADLRPEGPIFLNSIGNPWRKDAVKDAMTRLRARVLADAKAKGLPAPDVKGLIAYALRHVYITDAAAAGVAAPLLAELAGHVDLRMISTYSHVSDRMGALKDAAAKVRGNAHVTPPSPSPDDPASPQT